MEKKTNSIGLDPICFIFKDLLYIFWYIDEKWEFCELCIQIPSVN